MNPFTKRKKKKDQTTSSNHTEKQSFSAKDNAMVMRLRKKFVVTAMISLLIIVILIISVINIANFRQIDSSAADMLEILADNGGEFPDNSPDPAKTPSGQAEPNAQNSPNEQNNPVDPNNPNGQNDPALQGTSPSSTSPDTEPYSSSPPDQNKGQDPHRFPEMDVNETRRIEAPYQTRYFSVLVDASGEILNTNIEHIAAITEDTANEYALAVFYNGKEKGYASAYRYRADWQEDGSLLVIFVDCSSSLTEARQLLAASFIVGIIALLLMFVLVWLFSGHAVSPVVESLEKQKRFISDAGHELKTPITVIQANTDVLEMTQGENDWTQSIKRQTMRMTDLINNMLTLSRLEEDSIPMEFSRVNFSDIVKEAADSFEVVAVTNHLEYNMAIADNLYVSGDPKSLQQLCTVLLDNAMKYASDHGSVYISLQKESRKSSVKKNTSLFYKKDKNSGKGDSIILEVSNTCDAIPEGNLDRLFDRFYRADTSRTHSSRFTRRASKAGVHTENTSNLDNASNNDVSASKKGSASREISSSSTKPFILIKSESKSDSDNVNPTFHVDEEKTQSKSDHSHYSSRSDTGGFGIGLSVAKAVAIAHGGTISASSDADRLIRFKVSLPSYKESSPQTNEDHKK